MHVRFHCYARRGRGREVPMGAVDAGSATVAAAIHAGSVGVSPALLERLTRDAVRTPCVRHRGPGGLEVWAVPTVA